MNATVTDELALALAELQNMAQALERWQEEAELLLEECAVSSVTQPPSTQAEALEKDPMSSG